MTPHLVLTEEIKVVSGVFMDFDTRVAVTEVYGGDMSVEKICFYALK